MRADRVVNAVHFDMTQGDVTMTQTTGVQAETQTDSTEVRANPQTISSGTHSSKTKMDEFGGTQTTIIKKKIQVIRLLKIDLKK